MSTDNNNKWLKEHLVRVENKVDTLITIQNDLKIDLATHKIKSGFWGALMGFLAAITSHFFTGRN